MNEEPRRDTARLSIGDMAVLACLGEGATHGFRLAAMFAPDGEFGPVWTLRRPQVYRALEHLEARGLAHTLRQEAGAGGPPRTLFAPTERGRQALRAWLATPVERLRHGRNDLVLKLIFLERRGDDPTPLLLAQRERFERVLETYRRRLADVAGPESVALAWRVAAARAALAFLEERLRAATGAA